MFQMDQPGAQRTLNVGTIPLMAAYGILDLVSDFQKKHPNIVLHLEERESRDLPALLLNGKCDLAFLRERDDPDGFFTKMPFITDRLAAVLICAKKPGLLHRWRLPAIGRIT